MEYTRHAQTLTVCLAVLLVTACSCNMQQERDYRGDVFEGSPQAEADAVVVKNGLVQVTTSRDSDNLFFCPASHQDAQGAQWGVLASNRHSRNYQLYKKNLKHFSQGFITIPGADRGNNLFPALNRDDGRLAFCSDRDGSWRIYVLDLKAGTAPVPATPEGEDCLCPSWDPTSDAGRERFAFSRYNDRDERWEIWTAEAGSRRLTYIGPGLFPSWSPNGRHLAVQRKRERGAGQFGLWLLCVDENNPEPPQELFMKETWAAANPCWSPDGNKIVFNTVGCGAGEDLMSEGGDIYMIDLKGSGYSILSISNAWRPAWSKSGKIFFHQRNGDAVNIWFMTREQYSLQLAEKH